MSIFDAGRYNGSYMSCSYAPTHPPLPTPHPRSMKFTAFIGESVEKINQFPANTGVWKSYFKLPEKDCLNKKYNFL